MSSKSLRVASVYNVFGWLLMSLVADVNAATVMVARDPVEGAGFVDVEVGLPLVLGAPVGVPLEVDVQLTEMRHIELMPGASTDIEFGIGNTGNNIDLPYRILFNLSDEKGNLITQDVLDVQGNAQAGFIDIVSQPLTSLPPVIFHDFHILVETEDIGGTFDLYVAGGGGDPGTSVSGPITFNRAVVGVWIPEPSSALIGLIGFGSLLLLRRRRST